MIRLTPEQFESHQARVKGKPPAAEPKRNKFNAIKTLVDGITFDSRHEAEVYTNLRIQQSLGQITNLQTQVPLQVIVHGVHVFTYTADFRYVRDGKECWCDAKGYRKGTAYQLFKLKQKVIAASMGINVEEV